VLATLPEDMALDVVNRMLKMEAVQKEVIERVAGRVKPPLGVENTVSSRGDAESVLLNAASTVEA